MNASSILNIYTCRLCVDWRNFHIAISHHTTYRLVYSSVRYDEGKACIDTPVNIWYKKYIQFQSADNDVDNEVYFKNKVDSHVQTYIIIQAPSQSEPTRPTELVATKIHRIAQAVRVQILNKDNVFSHSLLEPDSHFECVFSIKRRRRRLRRNIEQVLRFMDKIIHFFFWILQVILR